jgi:hypothetical protein
VCGLLYACDDELLVRRGHEQLYNGTPGGSVIASNVFQDVLARDPASAYRWCNLGEALKAVGQSEIAESCFLRAYELAPQSAQILLNIGDFYHGSHQDRQALPYFGMILRSVASPSYDRSVFSYFAEMNLDFGEILRDGGLSKDRRVAQAYFRELLGSESVAEIRGAWSWLSSHSFSDERLAGEYVEFLQRQSFYEGAAEAWADAMRAQAPAYLISEFLFNGGFESEPSGTFFDWRVSPTPHVAVTRDSQVASSGKCSLRVRFDGQENVDYRGLSQRAFVRPGTYRLQAELRTEAITTDQGVSLQIGDFPRGDRLRITTEPLVGTTGWQRIEKTFHVDPQTKVVELQLVRRPSLKFDNKIVGTVWIDSVSLTRVQ